MYVRIHIYTVLKSFGQNAITVERQIRNVQKRPKCPDFRQFGFGHLGFWANKPLYTGPTVWKTNVQISDIRAFGPNCLKSGHFFPISDI